MARPSIPEEQLKDTTDIEVMGQYPSTSLTVVHEVSESPPYRAVTVRADRAVSPLRVDAELQSMADDLPKMLTRNWARPEVHEHLLSSALPVWERARRFAARHAPRLGTAIAAQWKNAVMAGLGVGLFVSIVGQRVEPQDAIPHRLEVSTSALPPGQTVLTSGIGLDAVGDDVAPPVPLFEMPPGIALDMPRRPFKGQKLPPCKTRQTEIIGGCWVAVKEAPPCGDDYFEHRDTCYAPIMVRDDGTEAPRQPSISQ
ncbi:hypothetical protein ACLEPN_30690 [Myxococcus sp. 1LA]